MTTDPARTADLSYEQERFYLLDALGSGAAMHNLGFLYWITGELDVAALTTAITELHERHEILRTRYPSVSVQEVMPARPVALAHLDLRDSAEPAAELRRVVDRSVNEPFDLAAAAPVRWLHCTLGPGRDALALVVHHIAFDAWSADLVRTELFERYQAILTAAPTAGGARSMRYADYAVEQRVRARRTGAAEIGYWTERLAGLPGATRLPFDRPPTVDTGFTGDLSRRLVPEPVVAAAARLARQEHATTFMVLMAAFAWQLAGYGDQRDFVIGVPAAGRDRPELERIVGCFVDTLPVRLTVSAAPTFRELIRLVREAMVAALQHGSLSVERVVASLRPHREPGREPLVQVSFGSVSWSGDPVGAGGPDVVEEWRSPSACGLDLTVIIATERTGTYALWEYKTELFEAATITRCQADFDQIIRWGSTHPDTQLTEFTSWSTMDRRVGGVDVAAVAPGSGARPARSGSLPESFAAQARRCPDAVAVVSGETQLTYRELDERSDELARRLVALGVTEEDRVGLLVDRSVDFVVAELAVTKAGGAYLPVDVRSPAERTRTVLTQAGCLLVLADRASLAAASELGVARVVAVDEPVPGAATATLPVVDPDQLAYVMFTSGSTGPPKGVAVRHRDVVARALDHQVGGEWERVLLHAQAAFDASTYELWVPLLNGGAVVVAPAGELDLRTLRETIADGRVTGMWLTGGLFRLVAQEQPECLAGVREVWTGSEVIPAEAVRRVLRHCPDTTVVYAYGPTEATIHATCHRMPDLTAVPDVLLIGRPLDGTRAYVLDPGLRPVPPGVVGEVYVSGAGVARGYLNRPAATARQFVPDPFGAPGERMYRTGDLARWTADGRLRFAGRIDEQVKIRGFRVEPSEIQRALVACAGVAQAAVIAREDDLGVKRLIAYLVAERGARVPEVARLRGSIAATLPDYMVPSAFVVLDQLPLTRNGKLDHRALPAPRLDRITHAAGGAPRTETERMLAGIWCQTLNVSTVDVKDNFFELGGHSLIAAQIVARISERAPGLPVRGLMRDVLRHPTFAEFAAILADRLVQHLTGARATGPVVPVVARGARLPLSLGQKRLWFLDQFVSDSAEYLVPLALRISGALDVAALCAALTEIVNRHEILRTSVVVHDDGPAGVVRSAGAFSVRLAEVGEAELTAAVATETTRPFDLEHDLPVRAAVLRVGADDHVLCLTVHHMVFDGWSVTLLFDELAALYGAFAAGEPSPLPPLTVQYADVTAYQEARLRTPELATKLDFWRAELAGAEAFELATDLPRPVRRTAPGVNRSFEIPAALVAELQRISAQCGATLFMTLLTAWQVLLHRYSGADDITVGTTAADRELTESESMIGLFINMLVLRGDLSGNPRFVDLLTRTRDRTIEAYAHQDVPFDRLVEELAPERDLARTPIFQLMIKLDNARQHEPTLPGLAVRRLPPPPIPAKYDVELGFAPAAGGLVGELTYDAGLYLPDTIDRLIGHFQTLLAEIGRDPTCPIGRIAMMTAAELAEVDELTARPAVPFPHRCLHELVADQIERTPDAVAVVQDDRTLRYGELGAWSDDIAAKLVAAGAGPDVPVGIVLDRSVEMVVALLGVLKAGSAYLPIEPDTPPVRIGQLVADAGAPVCLVEPELAGVVAAAGCLVLSVPAQPTTPSVARPSVDTDPDHLAAIYYTSGSTGKPKGVASTHAGWVNRMCWMQRHHPLRTGETVLHKTTLTFDDAAVEIFWPLLAGGRVAVLGAGQHRDPRAITDAVIRYQAVHVQFVPSMLELFLDELGAAELAGMSALRSVLSSGEALRPDLVHRFRDRFGDSVTLDNTWGATEVSIDSTCRVCQPADATGSGAVSVGRPIDNNEVHVLDPWSERLPVGVPGELCIGGVGLARGYLGDPRRTAQAFRPHPTLPGERVYRTGDWGRLGGDGALTFLSRRDDQVKIRGVRIELGEVEHALRAHGSVTDAAVLAWSAAPGDKRLAGYAVGSCSAAELMDHTRALLPVYAVPGSITMLPVLPRLPNGKLDRRSLPAPERIETGDDYVPPRTATEEALAGIWASVLEREKVGIHDDFFAIGGHSLLATRAIARMRQAFVAELPLQLIFTSPTVARAAAAIEEIVLAEVAELSDEQARALLD